MANKPRMTTDQEIELNDMLREDNDAFISSEAERQQQILRQQDEQLDMLQNNLHTVHELGNVISDSIKDQEVIIDDLSGKVETSDGKITKARKKIDEVIEKSSSLFSAC